MKYSIVIVTSSGEFRNLHLPGRDCGGGSSIQLKSFVLDFHRRLAGDFFLGGRCVGGIAPSRTVTPANIHEIA